MSIFRKKTGQAEIDENSLCNFEQKVRVLCTKMALKGHQIYDRVYLRSSKSHTERLLELKTKAILSELPNGHL